MQILQTLFTLFSASQMSNSNSPIKYKSTFLSKDLETVLLQQELQQGGVKNIRFQSIPDKKVWKLLFIEIIDSTEQLKSYLGIAKIVLIITMRFLRTKLSIIGLIMLNHRIQIGLIEPKKPFKKPWELW